MNADLTARVRTAHADAWQAEGRLREAIGGGTAELAGVRLMASGLPYAKWNNGDIDRPELVDVRAVRAWYAERDVPWGLRLPADAYWGHGRRLFRKRCMGAEPAYFRPVPAPPELLIRMAEPPDLDIVAALDAAAFDVDAAAVDAEVTANRAWIAPTLTASSHVVALASVAGEAVGKGVCVQTDDRAGPSVGIFGVGVVAGARRRGVGTALTSWLVERGFAGGATLAHLNPDTDDAARIYGRLGFVETSGLDVYVEV